MNLLFHAIHKVTSFFDRHQGPWSLPRTEPHFSFQLKIVYHLNMRDTLSTKLMSGEVRVKM